MVQNLSQLFLSSMKIHPTRKCINHHTYNHVYKLTQKYNELLSYYRVGKETLGIWTPKVISIFMGEPRSNTSCPMESMSILFS